MPLTAVSFKWQRPWERTNLEVRLRKNQKAAIAAFGVSAPLKQQIYFAFFFVSEFFSARWVLS